MTTTGITEPFGSHAAPAYPTVRTGCPLDLPPLVGELREERPGARVMLRDGSRPWVVSRYSDARQALRDPRLSADLHRPGFPFVSPVQKLQQNEDLPVGFLRMDPPEHSRQRRMLTQEFIVKRMQRMRPEVDAVVESLLDDMIAAGPPTDLVDAFALPLPSRVICKLLGVPYQDHDFFQKQSCLMLDHTAGVERVLAAREELRDYFDRLAAHKASHPADDLLSRLIAGQEVPGHLSHDEVVGMAAVLLVAGHETTANLIGIGVLNLLEAPDQWAALCEDPGLIPGAVEELLRYQTVIPTGLPRLATEDMEMGGVTIRAGEGVLAAADRDPCVFDAPDRLDVRHPVRRHLAFGFGVHQCLGLPLARVELQSALAGVVRRLPRLRVTKPLEELNFRHRMNAYGLFELPVVW
ncbi:cytochrome P450 [Streptomyces caelestis]|jgi:cytochrome P450|uniref:Cytochrome P450 n=1 Tax=Streptomyces caelestis TaxID=36816 RepID=A0A7W9GZJ0_9ACTN|nr:cytochrome P450 [Streptomyces caelestis]MBB5792907.1 cytochrome P450 [Streptomyces caelestis]GGW75687.1 cytochrome P450 [Streptomyces caelestis]